MMMKTIVRLHPSKPTLSNKPAASTWLRLTRTVSAALRAMLLWPAMTYRERRDMEQLGRMSERDLRDIGLIRQDLYDMQALPLGRAPTTVLGLRVHQRKRVRRHRATSRSDLASWGF